MLFIYSPSFNLRRTPSILSVPQLTLEEYQCIPDSSVGPLLILPSAFVLQIRIAQVLLKASLAELEAIQGSAPGSSRNQSAWSDSSLTSPYRLLELDLLLDEETLDSALPFAELA
jgi:hypothetical protein